MAPYSKQHNSAGAPNGLPLIKHCPPHVSKHGRNMKMAYLITQE